METLQNSGVDSVASLIDVLLQDDALDYAICRQMALAVLQHKTQTNLVNDREFRQQLKWKQTFFRHAFKSRAE